MGSAAMARGRAGNIATEENVKPQVVLGNQRPKSAVSKTPEQKRLKFHNVFFDKVMEMKEVKQVNKKETPKKSCRSKKRKATDELIIKEYNPARRRNEPPSKKAEGVKEQKEDLVTGAVNDKNPDQIVTPCNLHLDLQAATASGPLDLRTRVREATPESGISVSDSPGSSLQSSPESTPSSTLRLGSPPPLEPLPTQTTPKAVSRPFAEGFMWQLICQLRQEAPKARKEDKATVPSG